MLHLLITFDDNNIINRPWRRAAPASSRIAAFAGREISADVNMHHRSSVPWAADLKIPLISLEISAWAV